MKINTITNVLFAAQKRKNRNGLCQQPQKAISANEYPIGDTVSFKGKIIPGINTARKFIDYGDIFKPEAYLVKENLHKAKSTLAKLMNANLSKTNLSKSVFQCANFTGANLTGTNFENSSLDGSKFVDVITDDTNFKTTYLVSSIFDGKFGVRTNLEKANIIRADFKNADMDNIILSGAIYDYLTEFPNGFNPQDKKMFLYKEKGFNFTEDMNLERMKLRYLTFEDANFREAGLKRADFKGCNFTNCNMRNTDMTRVYAKEATLDNCDLRSSELKQLNLNKAYLRNVDMGNCNLRGAILTWRNAQNVNLAGSTYDQYTLFNSGFNPEAHDMIYKESSLAYYGIK